MTNHLHISTFLVSSISISALLACAAGAQEVDVNFNCTFDTTNTLAITCTDTSTEPNLIERCWTFGDKPGAPTNCDDHDTYPCDGVKETQLHTYDNSGTYTVVLVNTYKDGNHSYSGCQPEDVIATDPPDVCDNFMIEPKHKPFDYHGGPGMIRISPNDCPSGATVRAGDQEWITIAPPDNNNIVHYTVAPSKSPEDREGQILISHEGDTLIHKISQARAEGKIIIAVNAQPDHRQNFRFLSGDLEDFILDDDDDDATFERRKTFTVAPGAYEVSQQPVADWNLAYIVCDAPDHGTTVDLGTSTAKIDLDAGEEITCTFENRQPGAIIVETQTIPSGANDISYPFIGDIYGTTRDGKQLTTRRTAGIYYTTEELPPQGWRLTAIDCDDANSGWQDESSTTAIFHLETSETITCIFTNSFDLGYSPSLVVPGFEVEVDNPNGPTTIYAVRNTTDKIADVTVSYHSDGATNKPLRADPFTLEPQATLTQDVRKNLAGLNVNDGFATGLIVIAHTRGGVSGLEGDYFQLDPENDFASGDRLIRTEEFCIEQEIRFVDFGNGTRLDILLAQPRGPDAPSFSYTAYSEAGIVLAKDVLYSSEHLTAIDVSDLVPNQGFGTMVFDFSPAGSGYVTAEYSAYDRFSVEINGACRDSAQDRADRSASLAMAPESKVVAIDDDGMQGTDSHIADGDDSTATWSSGAVVGSLRENTQALRFKDGLSGVSQLILPGFEVDVDNPEGPNVFFAVRNTTNHDIDIDIAYIVDDGIGIKPIEMGPFRLAPQETLTQDVGGSLADLNISSGITTGLIMITESEGTSTDLEGDYFRVDFGKDSATGDRLVHSEEFCAQQEIRFAGETRLKILLNDPQVGDRASFSYTAYNEEGMIIEQGGFPTIEHLTAIDANDLLSSNVDFGTLVFDFSNAGGGFVTAEYSAFSRYSVELNGACTAMLAQ